ncbi:MAG TPA: DUF2207 domain-containing protein [Candidatus Dormibacteraeota bacterium]|nr:DUF2207 domain-containing protein [Candidatus Dormibacteraeota bacterium]
MKTLAARAALALALGSLLLVASPAPAAADEGWIITSFASDITIAPDSSLTVVEDIKVNFVQEHHGIFRTIPLRYRYDDSHDRYYNLEVRSVTDGSKPVPYDAYIDSDNEVIKIGDPSTLVAGDRRYVITYTVEGVMNSFSDHDELFWNVDGALWPVPKQHVSATVNVPAGSFQKAACYQGDPGSTETCPNEQSGSSVSFNATRQLDSGQEMSVVVALNKGAVTVPPPMLEDRLRFFPMDAFDLNPSTIGASLLVLLVGLGLIVWNWLAHGRDREYLTQYYLTNDPREHARPLGEHVPVAVEFGPPQNMRPAELGLILDESADPKDVTASIVDLAVRGHLTITEMPDWSDWKFTWKGAPAAELMPYEKTILDGMFTGRTEVKLSDLKGTFRPTLSKAESQIYDDAMTRRLFTMNPHFARVGWGCAGVAILFIGLVLTVMLGAAGWGLVGVAVAICGLVLTFTFPAMPQRTAAGRDLLQHTLGFRLYMTTAEKYREQFAAKAGIFNELLPYAIVFGCVALWAKAFEGIDTSATNNWYSGAAPFQAALLANSLQLMNANISTAISYVPPSSGSSSGFGGGGGFSGGGGGGGGGGAW